MKMLRYYEIYYDFFYMSLMTHLFKMLILSLIHVSRHEISYTYTKYKTIRKFDKIRFILDHLKVVLKVIKHIVHDKGNKHQNLSSSICSYIPKTILI